MGLKIITSVNYIDCELIFDKYRRIILILIIALAIGGLYKFLLYSLMMLTRNLISAAYGQRN